MNHDRYNIKSSDYRFEALISNFCRGIITERAGGLIYNFEDGWLEQEVWSLTDSIMEKMNDSIHEHLENNIPCWKSSVEDVSNRL